MTATQTAGRDWLRTARPAPAAAVRLACFPHAGGAATLFRPLAEDLARDDAAEVLAVQYPGRQDRRTEPVVTDLTVLADHAADRLAAAADGRPLVLFGHSMGALVAFETAERLQARGVPVGGLIVSGRRAPHLRRPDGDLVHTRTDEGLVAELRALGGTHDALLADEGFVRMILPAVRGDYQAVETYRRALSPAVLSCPVLALAGETDPRVTTEEARHWAAYTSGTFEQRTVPGGHFGLVQDQAGLSALLREQLLVLRGEDATNGTRPGAPTPRGARVRHGE
ncbi:thioesterase II family protein [Streptomyces sp. NPDC053493]|uniref:thioesterase II family protein n=1 Tax=Streptomyces sp. NPDC053493 TaxID=3365705 RepID=UPI0037D402CE